MKKLLLITALLCSMGFAKAQDATLKETTDWLTAKLNIPEVGPDNHYFIHQEVSFDRSICKLEITFYNNLNNDYRYWVYEFDLKDISLFDYAHLYQ